MNIPTANNPSTLSNTASLDAGQTLIKEDEELSLVAAIENSFNQLRTPLGSSSSYTPSFVEANAASSFSTTDASPSSPAPSNTSTKPSINKAPVYVKNTFLATADAQTLSIEEDYRSRTASCDAVLEGSRTHKLSFMYPKTVLEAYAEIDGELEEEAEEQEEDEPQSAADISTAHLFNKDIASETAKKIVALSGEQQSVLSPHAPPFVYQGGTLTSYPLLPASGGGSETTFMNDISNSNGSFTLDGSAKAATSVAALASSAQETSTLGSITDENAQNAGVSLSLAVPTGVVDELLDETQAQTLHAASCLLESDHPPPLLQSSTQVGVCHDDPIAPHKVSQQDNRNNNSNNSAALQRHEVTGRGYRHKGNKEPKGTNVNRHDINHNKLIAGRGRGPASSLAKATDLNDDHGEEGEDIGGQTTIMLRNIPNKYTQKMLLEVLNEDFRGLYDFFYLPIDFRNKCNVGYAFINFIHSHYAQMFKTQFDGLKLGAFKSHKVCEVSWGRVQGLQANIEHYRNSAVMSIPNPQYKPMLFRNGIIVPFPLADGPLPSIKLRPQKC